MDVLKETWKIKNKLGLHARPAQKLVGIASKYDCDIKVNANGMWVNAKSIMSVMGLGVPCGEELTVQAQGKDAAEAMSELKNLVTVRTFDEE